MMIYLMYVVWIAMLELAGNLFHHHLCDSYWPYCHLSLSHLLLLQSLCQSHSFSLWFILFFIYDVMWCMIDPREYDSCDVWLMEWNSQWWGNAMQKRKEKEKWKNETPTGETDQMSTCGIGIYLYIYVYITKLTHSNTSSFVLSVCFCLVCHSFTFTKLFTVPNNAKMQDCKSVWINVNDCEWKKQRENTVESHSIACLHFHSLFHSIRIIYKIHITYSNSRKKSIKNWKKNKEREKKKTHFQY